jgi:L-cysteine S-thiosulfotransferase
MVGSTPSRPRFSAERVLCLSLSVFREGGEGCLRELGRLGNRGKTPPHPPRRRGGIGKRFALFFCLAGGAGIAAITPLAADGALRPYEVIGDAIPASLTGAPGDPVRGKAIVVSRQTGLCLLCHSAPLPEEKFQGTIGPDLKDTGSRNTEGQLRLRIVDSRIFDPDTIMPAYYRLDGLDQVAPAFRGKTVLTAEQIEDVVAYLKTLRDK